MKDDFKRIILLSLIIEICSITSCLSFTYTLRNKKTRNGSANPSGLYFSCLTTCLVQWPMLTNYLARMISISTKKTTNAHSTKYSRILQWHSCQVVILHPVTTTWFWALTYFFSLHFFPFCSLYFIFGIYPMRHPSLEFVTLKFKYSFHSLQSSANGPKQITLYPRDSSHAIPCSDSIYYHLPARQVLSITNNLQINMQNIVSWLLWTYCRTKSAQSARSAQICQKPNFSCNKACGHSSLSLRWQGTFTRRPGLT